MTYLLRRAGAVTESGGLLAALTMLALSVWSLPVIAGDIEDKIRRTNYWLVGGIVGYGLTSWEWELAERRFHVSREHWFQASTKYGGADKLGHVYTGYVATRLAAALYRRWGMAPEEALREAVFSSVLMTTILEIGDGFSDFGFSPEDIVSNSAGQLAAYWLETHPALGRRLDLRLEYDVLDDEAKYDPSSDYNSMKYLVAVKFAGFERLNRGVARYLEFHLGYYTRGFDATDDHPTPERTLYAGLGLNLSELLNRGGYGRTGRIFNYLQMPGVYIDAGYGLDD
ncbi:MAG: DUF2279 domain-containing protein [Pseudomonadota bacterium]